MDFQLLRLILIDSYSPGRVVEFPVDGGAVLTGRNGRGKTTLLQLIPIFYGESPTRIVGAETNRLDFNGLYLPRLTSYICFEYRRREVPCLVVLHANEQGGERRYRFVRSAYRADLFLLPDGCNILQAPDLQRHFKAKGLAPSAAISSVSEYRGIIQGKVGSGKTWQNQRALAADFAFVGSGQHLTHIEKIVSGMFLRRTDFADLQRMVVSCIAEGDAEIALTTERRKIETWPEHYGAYTRAMEEAGRLTEALDRAVRLAAVEAELGRIHARMARLLAQIEETAATNRRQRARQSELANEASQGHRQATEGHRIRVETAGREAKDQEGRVAALERQQADWLRRDLPAKAELVRQEPELRARRGQLQQRREALLGEQGQISLKYERLIIDLDRGHTLTEAAATQARTDLFQGFEPRFAALDGALRTDLDGMREAHQAARQARDTQLQQIREQRGEWRQLVKAPQPEPELAALLAEKQGLCETLRTDQEAARAAVQTGKDSLAKAQADHAEHERGLRQLQQQGDALGQRRQQCLLQQNPGEDTLLYFLRRERPDWCFDIARVVREDLLVQAGLNPVLVDTLPALYGVGIDLEHLDAHRAADEQALRQELAEIEGQRAQLDQLQEQAEQALKACEKLRRQADEALALANAELHKAGTRLASARQEVEAAGRRVEQSRQAAKAQAEARLQAIEQGQAVIEGQIRDLDQGHRDAVKAREDRHGQERGALDAERQAALHDHDRTQEDRRQRHVQERARIGSERDQALGAAGVDTAALTALQGEMDDADQQLRRIDQGRNEVNQWQLWQQNDWPRQAEHAAAARAARDSETAARADLAAEEARWKARAAELDGALRALDREHVRLEQEAAAVRGRLDGFRDYPADAQVMGQPFDPGWTLDALTAQANGNQQEATGLGQVIGKLVEQIKRAFAAQRGTPPDDFYESHRTGLGPDAPARAWVPVFKGWFDTDHDAYRRTLAVEANQIAGAIVAFHRDMESFHRKVQQFNRELQQSLDENLGFESVSRVTVEVKSVIRELAYWQPIEAMAEEQRAWLSLHGQDLPPPAFAATLRTLLEHWEVREGIRAALPNLIRIQGEVVENGQTRTFRKAADLERVSSNGLSYLILCVIFIAFINRIRRGAAVEICWALDELKDLDIGNIEALLTILRRNAITLVSAFPDPDADVLALFRHRFSVEEGRRLMEARVVGADEGDLEPKVSPS